MAKESGGQSDVWKSSLQRLQNRLERVSDDHGKMEAVLIEAAIIRGTKGNSKCDSIPPGFGEHDGIETSLSGGMNQVLLLYGGRPACSALCDIAREAGRLLTNSPPVVRQMVMRRTPPLSSRPKIAELLAYRAISDNPLILWTSSVFWLARDGRLPSVNDERRVWYGRSACPIDQLEDAKVRHEQFAADHSLDCFTNIPDPPDRWYSVLEDFGSASVAAIEAIAGIVQHGTAMAAPKGTADSKENNQIKLDAATEARDKWIYDECVKGTVYKKIINRLKTKQKSWGRITSVMGIKDAAERYATRHKLKLPAKRKQGRRPNTN